VTSRRNFLAVFAGGILAAPLAAEAQSAGKVYRIGSLRWGADPNLMPLADAMRELGWIEGQNFKIERRYADRDDQLPALAAELVRLKVDLILTGGTVATQAAKEATKTIPILFLVGDDPVISGLVASFARPGGNLTGFAFGQYDEKLLELLKEAFPLASRVAFPAPMAESSGPRVARLSFEALVARLSAAAQILGVEIRLIEVRGPQDFDSFFAAAKRRGANAVLVPNIVWFRPHLERLGVLAAKSHLPAIGYDRRFAESGGLLAYGPTLLQNAPRLAAQIDKILKGAKPADLPVEQPTKFELVINLKTAKTLGLTIPQTLRLRADQVIE
jgi:putative tryptophan/tyrosine transport system substrate-binding protein